MDSDSTTLTRDDYCSPAVFAAERERFFNGGWFYACHADSLPPSHRRVVDVAGESVIVTRDRRRRAARPRQRLPPPRLAAVRRSRRRRADRRARSAARTTRGPTRSTVRCAPRHASRTTLDRSTIALWRHHVAEWNGLIFVSLADSPPALAEWLADHTPDLATFDALRIDAPRCRRPHRDRRARQLEDHRRELPRVPALRGGASRARRHRCRSTARATSSIRPAPTVRSSWPRAATASPLDGRSTLSVLPGTAADHEVNVYRGCAVFPNVLLDVTGTSASLTSLFPDRPGDDGRGGGVPLRRRRCAAPTVSIRRQSSTSASSSAGRTTRCANASSEVSRRERSRPASCTDKDRFVADFVAHYRATLAAARVSHRQPGGTTMTGPRAGTRDGTSSCAGLSWRRCSGSGSRCCRPAAATTSTEAVDRTDRRRVSSREAGPLRDLQLPRLRQPRRRRLRSRRSTASRSRSRRSTSTTRRSPRSPAGGRRRPPPFGARRTRSTG